MKYCKKCVQTSTRPNINFRDDGVCMACDYEEKKHLIDWTARENELKEIAEWAKKNTNCSYDCVCGISGGKDSTITADYAKNKLGLNVLLVCNEPDGATEVGKHNLENLRNYEDEGFDLLKICPNPVVMKSLTKKDFFTIGNPVKSSEYSLWSSAYRVAIEKKIPLVIQGENPALIFGLSDGVTGGDALTIKNNNTIDGCNANDLVITPEEAKRYGCNPVRRCQLDMFDMPSFEGANIKGVFLQYYMKEWSQIANAEFAVSRGLLGRYTEKLQDIGRYRRETSVDGDLLITNQYLKFLKFGFGFCTDQACYDIRENRKTREEGIYLVKKYDGKIGMQYIKQFCDYIEITEKEFWETTDKFVNKKLFTINFDEYSTKRYTPKFEVAVDFN